MLQNSSSFCISIPFFKGMTMRRSEHKRKGESHVFKWFYIKISLFTHAHLNMHVTTMCLSPRLEQDQQQSNSTLPKERWPSPTAHAATIWKSTHILLHLNPVAARSHWFYISSVRAIKIKQLPPLAWRAYYVRGPPANWSVRCFSLMWLWMLELLQTYRFD